MLTQSLDRFQLEQFPEQLTPKKRKRLSTEYQNLNTETHLSYLDQSDQYKTGRIYSNEAKNRYSDIIPIETTRVKLEGLKNDYINANHIFIEGADETYISTQAPLSKTYKDFWKMVWDQKSSIIVMLTDFKENGKKKASKYWDSMNKPKVFTYLEKETINDNKIDIVVTLVNKIKLCSGILREFIVSKDDESRKIFHIQYTNWGDHTKPTSIKDIQVLIMYMELFREIGKLFTLNGPPIIHCSAGVGRSGTFIACSFIKYLKLHRKKIDIHNIVVGLRKCRSGMVQTDEQYAFIYQF